MAILINDNHLWWVEKNSIDTKFHMKKQNSIFLTINEKIGKAVHQDVGKIIPDFCIFEWLLRISCNEV